MEYENIVNIGYTNKLSYINTDKVKLYIDSIKDDSNTLLYIKNMKGDIVKKIYTDVKNQINRWTTTDIYHYKYGLYDKPWEDFELDLTCEFEINEFKSGIYIINEKIVFIVSEYYNVTNRAPICCLISTNTINMYNHFGGKNSYFSFLNNNLVNNNDKTKGTYEMYDDLVKNCKNRSESERARLMQINRPLNPELFFKYNYGVLKFLFNTNYKVNYITDFDLHNNIYNAFWDNSVGDQLKLFIISGHSEYWTLESKQNLEKINEKGTHILNLSGNTCWSRIKYKNNKILHQRFKGDFDFVHKKYKDLIDKTYYFSYQNNNTFKTLGVDYYDGGHNHKKNKYYNFDKEIKLLSDINEIELSYANAEFDGFKTDFCITNNIECLNLVNNPEKIKDYKHLFKLSKEYDNYKYKQILMYGATPLYNKYPDSVYKISSTGIIALKKNENSGIIINCCYSAFCTEGWDHVCEDRFKHEHSNSQKTTSILINTLLEKNIDFNKTFKNYNKYNCSVCDTFMEPLENRYCNNCGSVERHRCLVKSIKEEKINNLLFNEHVLILSEGKRKCNKYYESSFYFNKICKIDTMDIREFGGTCFSDNQYFDYVHNCEDLSFIKNGKYQGIVLNHVLSAIKNDLTALYNFNRILKKDGILIITDSISNDRETHIFDSSTSTMCCRLYGKDFSEILKNFFDEIKIFDKYDLLTESTTSTYICFKNNKNISKITGSSTLYKKNISYLQ